MGELNDFYKKIQMYLMKKNQELGDLKLITVNVTAENKQHVDDICKSMTSIFQNYNIPIAENAAINNEKGIQAYKYLLLNTNFENQGRLAEDIANGHLVDMCPPLSPFLFMKILWSLQYEQILVESLLYIPFDLCVEILKLIPEHMNKLPYERLNNVMYKLMFHIHIKLHQLKESGIQSAKVEDSVKNWLLASEEYLLLLKDSKLCCLTNISGLPKCERFGFMLKKLIAVTHQCLQIKGNGITISKDLEKLYGITCGQEPFVKWGDESMENALSELNQQLIELLVIKLKEVDCITYLSWAELYDQDNVGSTLQRSIGIDSYYFIDFISKDEELSSTAHHLVECLQHLSCKPNPQSAYALSMAELREAISGGRRELMDELFARYKEWDHTILDFLDVNSSLLDYQGGTILLEYLTYLLRETDANQDDKEHSYHMVMKILTEQNVRSLYKIVMMYLIKYNGRNCLGTSETCEAFVSFITHNTNIRYISVLKFLMLYLLKDLEGVLTILLKISIGLPQYRHIMIAPNDMILLSGFYQIRDDNNEMLLTAVLRKIFTANTEEWHVKKFTDLLTALLDSYTLPRHELVNHVIIAYLMEDTLNVSNLHSLINVIRIAKIRHTREMNTKDLAISLARRMSSIRKNTNHSKYVTSQLLINMARIVEQLNGLSVPLTTRESMASELEEAMQPVDKPHFSAFWQLGNMSIKGVMAVMEDYERRCFWALNRLREDPRIKKNLRQYLMDFNLLREDFFHHLIIHMTEEEYKIYFMDLVISSYSFFNWSNEVEAYSNITRLTIEACCLYLAFPSIGGQDLFPFLLKSFIRFSRALMDLKGFTDYESVYGSIVENMQLLYDSVKQTPYDYLFTECLLLPFDNHTERQTRKLINHKLLTLEQFSDQCHELVVESEMKNQLVRPMSRKLVNFYRGHEVINVCLDLPATNIYDCVKKFNEIFNIK